MFALFIHHLSQIADWQSKARNLLNFLPENAQNIIIIIIIIIIITVNGLNPGVIS